MKTDVLIAHVKRSITRTSYGYLLPNLATPDTSLTFTGAPHAYVVDLDFWGRRIALSGVSHIDVRTNTTVGLMFSSDTAGFYMQHDDQRPGLFSSAYPPPQQGRMLNACCLAEVRIHCRGVHLAKKDTAVAEGYWRRDPRYTSAEFAIIYAKDRPIITLQVAGLAVRDNNSLIISVERIRGAVRDWFVTVRGAWLELQDLVVSHNRKTLSGKV